jgi:hypothetical protein
VATINNIIKRDFISKKLGQNKNMVHIGQQLPIRIWQVKKLTRPFNLQGLGELHGE